MPPKTDGQYSVLRPCFTNRISYKKRIEMFHILTKLVCLDSIKSALDVGATSDIEHEESNFFEQLFPCKSYITALSNQDASHLESLYAGLKFVRADALNMPFPDSHFDLVFSSAVMEHVGSYERQLCYLRECIRVAGKYVFITTPNRYFPVEFHTCLPLLHWLPKRAHRVILSRLRLNDLALEANLNLLSYKELHKMLVTISNYGGGG